MQNDTRQKFWNNCKHNKFVFNVSLTRFFEKYVNAKKIAILIAPEKSSVLLDRKIDYSWNFEILKWQNLVPTMN